MKKITKKILILLTTIITLNSTFGQNITDDNNKISIEWNGFCANQTIEFEIYNLSEFKIKKKIEKDLCENDENPVYDNCKEFQKIKTNIKIYDGPSDYFKIKQELRINENEFKIKFETENDYLMEIEPIYENQFKKKEIIISIDECKEYNKKLNQKNNPITQKQNNSNNQTTKIINQTQTLNTTKIENKENQKQANQTNQTFIERNIKLINEYSSINITNENKELKLSTILIIILIILI